MRIWPCDPEIVMIRSCPWGSAIVIAAPESALILRILIPPFPIMAPAYCNKKYCL